MLSTHVAFTKISHSEHQHCSEDFLVKAEIQVLRTLFPHEEDSETHLKLSSSPHFSSLSEHFNIFLVKISCIAKLSQS